MDGLINHLLIEAGYVGIVFIIFAGPGLFVGFVLPGDSVLFTAGLLAQTGVLHLGYLLPMVVLAAFFGYEFGYWFGARLGLWLLSREERWYFKRAYLHKAEDFYKQHGAKALLLARLIPIVRTFVPIVAGMAKMPRRVYVLYNLIGSLIWAGGITLLGFALGDVVPHAQHYILPIVLVVVLLSVLPALKQLKNARRLKG